MILKFNPIFITNRYIIITMQPIAHIITIGDELLIGQVVDTNSAFIGSHSADAGIRVGRIISISDSKRDIISTIKSSLNQADIIIVTGGLGPTKDDISKHSIAQIFDMQLVRDEPTYLHVKDLMEARGVEFNELNQAQADIPEGFLALKNEVGTAPGLYYNDLESKTLLFCLPGVPFEMKKLFQEAVLPLVAENFDLQPVLKHTIQLYGIPESELAELVAEWEDALPSYLKLAYLPNPKGIRMRLSSLKSGEEARAEIQKQFEALRVIIPEFYLGDEPCSVEEELAKLLKLRGESLAVAESCTGGAISARCTAMSGASEWYLGSVTSYSNGVKMGVLGVDPKIIDKQGAVSGECVAAMAEGVRRITGATYGIATSGVAGPTGGSDEKPLGYVWIGVSTPEGTYTYERNFGQPREVFIERCSTAALNYLRLELGK